MGDRSHQAIASLVGQLLDDPLVQLVMNADRVDRGEAEALLSVAALSVEVTGLGGIDAERALIMRETRAEGYRQGVGIVLFNKAGKIFVGERVDIPGAWQMPQGGIDEGEPPLEAALRELEEEVGTSNVRLLNESPEWLTYELPAELVGKAWGGRWKGQQQKWFAMLFVGEDQEINTATTHPEFSSWKWTSFEEALSLIAPFKREVYAQLAEQFADLKQTFR